MERLFFFTLGVLSGILLSALYSFIKRKKEKELMEALVDRMAKESVSDIGTTLKEYLDSFVNLIKTDWSRQRSEMEVLVKPLEETLREMGRYIREIEIKREGAYRGLQEQIKNLVEASLKLQDTTKGLLETIKPPTVRGRWGEVQLRRVVELAGMVEHVDFSQQVSSGDVRPDMVVHLPGGGIILVDAKTPFDWDMKEPSSQLIRRRIKELSKKEYWRYFKNSPEFVVMFLPLEAPLIKAFEEDRELLDFALSNKVLIATPVTLLALLKAVSYGWQQYKLSEDIKTVAELGKNLYERLVKFSEHMERLKRAVENLVKSYNDALSSLKNRVIPAARKLGKLSGKEGLKEPEEIEI